eukprot:240343-Alexandrium_andersonii.AAC.1
MSKGGVPTVKTMRSKRKRAVRSLAKKSEQCHCPCKAFAHRVAATPTHVALHGGEQEHGRHRCTWA